MKTRRFLAALLAVMLLLSMIPLSASAADDVTVIGKNIVAEYNKVDYSSTTSTTITVAVQDYLGNNLENLTLEEATKGTPITFRLIESAQATYDIESASIVDGGSFTYTSGSAKEVTYQFTANEAEYHSKASLVVTLCPPFENPNFENGKYGDDGLNLYYYAYEPALLKLLYVNGVNVNKDTEISGVKFHHVEQFSPGVIETDLTKTNRGDNTITYWYRNLSNVLGSEKGNPYNIRYLEISYKNGEVEGTKKVYSRDLRYVNVGDHRYNIEANNDDTSIVAFYNEDGGDSRTWSLYDVTFVETGDSYLPKYEMPDDPVYGDGSQYQFVNWDHSVGGGDPFLTYEPITNDTVLYAQKISSDYTGTEYHLMNPDNALMNRVLELYNAGATSPVESIEPGTIEVQINSTEGTTSTNKEYFSNGWYPLLSDDRDYYKVYAGSAPGEPEPVTNAHVHPNDAASATIFFQIGDKEASVVIPIGNARPGDLGLSLPKDNIAELIVNPAPAAPDDDDMTGDDNDTPDTPDDDIPSILGDGAVKVECITEDADGKALHEAQQYNIQPNSVGQNDSYLVHEDSVKTVVNDDGTYGYTCEVTIYAGPYVDKYSTETEVAHTVNGDDSQTITLTWNTTENEWAPNEGEVPVTFNVTCDGTGTDDPNEPEPPTEEELAPTDPEVPGLLGNSVVTIDCVNDTVEHADATYALLANTPGAETKDSFTIGEVEKDETTGDYTCDITILPGLYVAKYEETYDDHTLATDEQGSKTVILTWDADGGENQEGVWVAPQKIEGQTAHVTFNVTCDGTGTDDPNKPDPPEEEDITGDDNIPSILGDIPVQVACTRNGSGHDPAQYDVIPNTGADTKDSFTIGDVVKVDDTNTYTCDITILPGLYVAEYNETNAGHTLVAGEDNASKTITLVWVPDETTTEVLNDGKWTVPTAEDGEPPIVPVTFEVECEKPYSPPYVNPNPPADPDDTGVSDLLETDDHIQYLFGYPEGTFGPDRNMTRAEVAQMFYNLLVDQNVAISQVFTDVPADAWYAKAVNTLAALGVISGVGDGKFEPDRAINRAEFTTMAMKFAVGKTGGENMFSDVDENDWFYQAVVDSIQYGWITGYGDGTFRPYKLITRAEVTAIVNHMLGREADEDYVQLHQAELTPFTDLTSTHWGYYHIVEATNEHDYIHGSDPEDWTNLA